ncbi:hypothetical protein NDN08_007818 [Rhodosorus marinus]|uniref:Uncharacterized protein n=1 Tax=Rhodosorus marinus TaxID=101924 RepID=A0AAV8V279_9RHOD|nr:hypothetical protein NDN08_007818 [Rhodosorus marinus]
MILLELRIHPKFVSCGVVSLHMINWLIPKRTAKSRPRSCSGDVEKASVAFHHEVVPGEMSTAGKSEQYNTKVIGAALDFV